MTKIILCGKILVGKKQNKKGVIEMELEELKRNIEAGGKVDLSAFKHILLEKKNN